MAQDLSTMKACSRFNTCNANLCPLDQDRELRTWFIGEAVCSRPDFRELPWIRRQRKLNRVKPLSLVETAMKIDYLTETAPPKRVMSPEQREICVARLAEYRSRIAS